MIGKFDTTRWSIVIAAGASQTAVSRDALGALCEAYWKPLYYFARGHGVGNEDAQDLVQAFLARMIERSDVSRADAERGRFRTFLLTSFRRFQRDEWQKSQADKRGGGVMAVSLDLGILADKLPYASSARTPEQEYERQWALALIDGVVAHLEREYTDDGKGAVFHVLQGIITGEELAGSYASIGESLKISEGAVKMAAQRLKTRYKRLLREHVAQTLEDESNTMSELEHLMQALRA